MTPFFGQYKPEIANRAIFISLLLICYGNSGKKLPGVLIMNFYLYFSNKLPLVVQKMGVLLLLIFLSAFPASILAGQITVLKNGVTYNFSWDNTSYAVNGSGFLTSPSVYNYNASINGQDNSKAYSIYFGAYQGTHCYWNDFHPAYGHLPWYTYLVNNTEGMVVALIEAENGNPWSGFDGSREWATVLGVTADGGPTENDTGGHTYISENSSFNFAGMVDVTVIYVPWSGVFAGSQTINYGSNSISVLLTAVNGSATAKPPYGSPGSTSILTAAASPGYRFLQWNVVVSGGGTISSTTNATAIFTFGNGNASIEAVFQQLHEQPGDPSLANTGHYVQDPQGFWGEPVDTGTGAFLLSHSLLKLYGAQTVEFSIDYNSLSTTNDVVGVGWSHNYEASLVSSTNGSIQINWNAKSFTSYSAVSNNIYRSTDLPARYDVLYSNANGSYKLVKPDQKKYVFDASGRLVAAVNPHGQTVNILYTSASSQQPVQI